MTIVKNVRIQVSWMITRKDCYQQMDLLPINRLTKVAQDRRHHKKYNLEHSGSSEYGYGTNKSRNIYVVRTCQKTGRK